MKSSLTMQALPVVQNLSFETSFLNLDTNPAIYQLHIPYHLGFKNNKAISTPSSY